MPLGSASLDLMNQASESLARRVAYVDLGPINIDEARMAGIGIARNLSISNPTVGRYLDSLEALHLLRRLRPWHAKLGKRLAKVPKVYLRDSGIVHAQLGIDTMDTVCTMRGGYTVAPPEAAVNMVRKILHKAAPKAKAAR